MTWLSSVQSHPRCHPRLFPFFLLTSPSMGLPEYLSSSPICVLLFILTMSVLVQTPILPGSHQACFLIRTSVSQGQRCKTVLVRVPQDTGSHSKVASEDRWMKDHLQSWGQTPGQSPGWRRSSPRRVIAGSYCHCWLRSSRTSCSRKGVSQLQLWPQVGHWQAEPHWKELEISCLVSLSSL